MRRMGIAAVSRGSNTSKPAPGGEVYPYLLRCRLIDRSNQVWAIKITYSSMEPLDGRRPHRAPMAVGEIQVRVHCAGPG